jgi:hypothetical protein
MKGVGLVPISRIMDMATGLLGNSNPPTISQALTVAIQETIITIREGKIMHTIQRPITQTLRHIQETVQREMPMDTLLRLGSTRKGVELLRVHLLLH